MKKKFAIFTSLMLSLMCFVPTVSFADGYYVSDSEGILTSSQSTILETRCGLIEEEGLELVIALDDTNDVQAADAIDGFADDLLSGSGVVVCLNDDTKTVAVKGYGDEEETFSSDVCSEIQTISEEKYSAVGVFEACQSAVYNIENVIYGYDIENVDFYMPSVIDMAGYVTEDESAEISEKLDQIRTAYDFDVAIIVSEELMGDTSEEAADDLYDYYFYGAGEDDNGILLYVNEDPREYWITTYASGETRFNDEAIQELKDTIVSYMSDDDYYSAFMAYGDTVEKILAATADGSSYKEAANVPLVAGAGIVGGLIIAFLIASLMTASKKKLMNNAVKASCAHEYMKKDSLNLEYSRDMYLYSNVIRTAKPDDNDGGSSSSGRSHGGGGGSY